MGDLFSKQSKAMNMLRLCRVLRPALVLFYLSLPATGQGQTRIRLHLEEGFQFEARLASEVRCLTELYPDERLDYRRETAVGLSCGVTERHPDGSMGIAFSYKWIRDVRYSGGHPDTYDSADPNRRRPGIAPTYREKALDALLGRSFVAEITSEGKVCRIQGLEDLHRGLHDALAYRWTEPRKIKISDESLPRISKEMEEMYEQNFQECFGTYWPLSEERLKEAVQQLFLVWPRQVMDTGRSWRTEDILPALGLSRDNSWTLQEQKADTVVVVLLSHVRTDLNLCDPNASDADPTGDFDLLDDACHWYRTVKHAPMYAGERKGSFTVDAKSGLIQHATCTEELLGICPLKDPAKGRPEPFACPSKRTQTVAIEITPVNAISPSE